MMRRLFWVALGAAAGVLVVRRLGKVARSVTPEGAADRVSEAVGGLNQAIRDFADDVRAGMDEREAELRQALGIASESSVVATPDDPHPIVKGTTEDHGDR